MKKVLLEECMEQAKSRCANIQQQDDPPRLRRERKNMGACWCLTELFHRDSSSDLQSDF